LSIVELVVDEVPVFLLRAVDCFVVFLRGIFADEHVVRRPLEIDLRRPSVRDELQGSITAAYFWNSNYDDDRFCAEVQRPLAL